MTFTLKTTAVFILIIGLQLNNMEITLNAIPYHSSTKIYNYEAPDRGGPESSQAAGTR